MNARLPVDVAFLGQEHETILRLLITLRELGLFVESSRYHLLELESAIMNHLDQEEKWLYPALWRKVAGLPELRHKVNHYHALMLEVTMRVAHFFDLYHRDEERGEIQQSFDALLPLLQERMRVEDEFLYPLLHLADI